jgi:hypothetical protein
MTSSKKRSRKSSKEEVKKLRKVRSSQPKKSPKRHSKFVSSFTRKDGIYVKSHFREVGGKRQK